MQSFVYFLQAKGAPAAPVKIGYSQNPWYRAHDLNGGYPFGDLAVLLVFTGTLQDEKALHRRFAPLRIRREWFRPEGELRAVIDFFTPVGEAPHGLRLMADYVQHYFQGLYARSMAQKCPPPVSVLARVPCAIAPSP